MTILRATGYEGVRAPVLRPQFAQRMAGERERGWAAMRLLELGFETDRPHIPAGHRRVGAVLRLGQLTPADVRVHLATTSGLAHDAAPGEALKVRLTCARPYGDGVYLFEGLVAEEALRAPEALRVLVEPGLHPDAPMALVVPAGRRRVFAAPDG